jgi:hypothetical protein
LIKKALFGAEHERLALWREQVFELMVGVRGWAQAERLVHKLIPANDKQRNAIEIARRIIWWFYVWWFYVWWFYRALKEYKLAPRRPSGCARNSTASPLQNRLCHPRPLSSFASRTISCASSTLPVFRSTRTRER